MKSARVTWGLTLGLLLIVGCSVGLTGIPTGCLAQNRVPVRSVIVVSFLLEITQALI